MLAWDPDEPCLATTVDRREVRAAIAEDASGRAQRLAARIETLLRRIDDPGETLEGIGAVVRSSGELERLLAAAPGTAVAGSSYFERFATLRAISSGVPMRMRTSIEDVRMDRDLARCVALIICELVEVVELSGTGPPDLMFAAEERDRSLLVALAATGGEAHPVPTGDGARALRRAERLSEACGGGLTRGVRAGMMLFGMALPVAVVRVGALERLCGREAS